MNSLPPPDPRTRVKWEYAGFWSRFIARIGDNVVALIYASPILVGGIFLIALGVQNCDTSQNTITCTSGQVEWTPIALGILALVAGVVFALALPIRWIAKTGAGPVSRKMRVRVVCRRTGQPIGTGRAVGRLLGSFVSGWIFYLGYLWMLWDSEKQTWHDKMVSSMVIRA
ncbi:MAG: RDD family protein [Ilumatobacteraceae bacterium]|jgi:uncharacterized RDD family membrane protein YckC